jgi:hypothetical protein
MFNLWSALANGLIAIEQLLFAVYKAWCKGVAYFESAGDGFHFLLGKLASAHAIEDSIVLVHSFLLSCFVFVQASLRTP